MGSFFRNSHGSASEMNCWTTLQGNSSENLPLKFLSQPFCIFFSFLSCHALTPNFLGCPSAYEMHYVISKPHMTIYHHANIDKIHIHTTCYLIHINNIKINSHELINNPIPMAHTQLYFYIIQPHVNTLIVCINNLFSHNSSHSFHAIS